MLSGIKILASTENGESDCCAFRYAYSCLGLSN